MSNIEWTDSTWNPVIGCRRVAEGCRHCYAETMSKRLAAMGQKDYASILDAKGKFNGKAITRPATLAEPLSWKKPRMVFVNSMSDLFHEDVPFEFIAAVFGVMAACPRHTFQVLTKRPDRALEFCGFRWATGARYEGAGYREACNRDARRHVGDAMPYDGALAWPLKNVWLGVSIATQADADKNIPTLLKCPAAVRFVSAEPLVEAVALGDALHTWRTRANTAANVLNPSNPLPHEITPALDWVIVGGESGPGARPCDVAWIRSIVEQCATAEVPCFVKQVGSRPRSNATVDFGPPENRTYDPASQMYFYALKDRKGGNPAEWPEDLRVRQFPEVAHAK